MADSPRVTRIRFTPAPSDARSLSLVGYVSFSLLGIGRLDGISVRKTGNGYSLSFPSRKDRSGQRHPYFVANSRATHETMVGGVLDALRERGDLP